MTLHLNLPGSSHRNNNEQQQEVREARRILKERIRTDWEYPTLPAWQSSGRVTNAADETSLEDKIAGFRFHNPHEESRTSNGNGEALGLDFDPIEWRERGYSSEESDLSSTTNTTPTSATTTKSKNSSTYKFDSPDSVGTQLSDRRAAKKRKRNEALSEEMEWNDGLAHWIQRRDKWCCARTASQVQLASSSAAAEEEPPTSASASAGSTPRTSTSSAASSHVSSTPNSTPSSTPDLSTTPPTTTAPLPSSTHDKLYPLAPPFLPNHPIRRRISPQMYPEIYTKIILQSRTPSVPINLQQLVNALVAGWKDDGEWPPKNPAPEKSIGRKKGTNGGLREGVKAVGKILRLTGAGERSATHNV